jgi:hypothetical protein
MPAAIPRIAIGEGGGSNSEDAASGSTRYQAFIRRDGTVKKKTFRTRAAAERWATRTEAAIIDGKEIPTAAAERRKLAAVLDAYMAEALAGLRAAANRRAQLEWWKDRLGPIPVLRLRRENVRQQLAALERG